MSLNLDWTQCEEDTLAEAFGFYMMFTDIGWELTEKNIEDFYVRVKMHEKIVGPIYHQGGEPIVITSEVVKKYIGLKANVSPRTFTQFSKNLIDHMRSDLQKEYRRV